MKKIIQIPFVWGISPNQTWKREWKVLQFQLKIENILNKTMIEDCGHLWVVAEYEIFLKLLSKWKVDLKSLKDFNRWFYFRQNVLNKLYPNFNWVRKEIIFEIFKKIVLNARESSEYGYINDLLFSKRFRYSSGIIRYLQKDVLQIENIQLEERFSKKINIINI